MQYAFGAGRAYAIPLGIAVPTPVQFRDLQSFSLDCKYENKTLYGSSTFPLAAVRGKGTAEVKLKNALVGQAAFSSLLIGTPAAAGMVMIAGAELLLPASNTASAANAATWVEDLGLTYANGMSLTRVVSAPTAGQYAVAAGVYTFAAGDVAAQAGVYASYRYTVPNTGYTSTVANTEMGQSVQFALRYFSQSNVQGALKSVVISLNACTMTDWKFDSKNDDFAVPDMSISAFADAGGIVGTISFSE